MKKKNKDYGDAFATYGPVGVLVRIGDKIQRLQNITSKGINLNRDWLHTKSPEVKAIKKQMDK